MSTETKTRLIPKLRFPEFRREKEWDSTRLGNLCEAITKGSTPTTYGFDYVNSGVRFVKIESLSDGLVDCTKTSFITDECNDAFARSQLKENDILFSIAGALGVIALVERTILPANINQAIGVIRLKQGYSHRFLLHQLQAELIQSEIQRIKAGAAQPNISLTQLGDFTTLLPSLAEQQKIANCLSSLDELIAAQARKVEALKIQKKGLMQQLSPREGETQPRLRFPEFQGAREWKVKPLGEIFPITSSKRVHESDWTATGVPFYRAREIVALNKHEPIQPLFISEELYAEFSKLTGEIREDHLLVTGVGSIGVPYLVKAGDRFYFKDGNIIWLKNDGKELSGDFLLRLYETDYVQKQLKKMADVGTVATYTIDNAKRTLAAFPTEKVEQQRIANCLSSLDNLITAATQKLDTLKSHKKGLMQQLFPNMENAA